jgi:hypothetical protein
MQCGGKPPYMDSRPTHCGQRHVPTLKSSKCVGMRGDRLGRGEHQTDGPSRVTGLFPVRQTSQLPPGSWQFKVTCEENEVLRGDLAGGPRAGTSRKFPRGSFPSQCQSRLMDNEHRLPQIRRKQYEQASSPAEKRGASGAGVCNIDSEPWQFTGYRDDNLVMGMGTTSLINQFHEVPRLRGVASRSKFPFAFCFSFFFSEVSDTFSVLDLYLSYRTTIAHLPFLCRCSTLPSRCMEHCRMHSQQLLYNAHDAASLDILQSPFYPTGFPDFLDGSKVTQAPHPSPSYVQQQYDAPDSGVSLEGGSSPPLPYHILQQPQQGHPRLDPSPPPQQRQHYQTVAYPLFPHDHERPYQTPQGLSHRAPAHSARMSISPWPIDAFSDNARAQPTALREGISPIYGSPYALRPQPLYHPPPTYRSAPTSTHAPPEQAAQSQTSKTPCPSTLHEQHEDRATTDRGQRSHSWGGVGSLDPATGVFSQASDHPRIRTAQACEKCRARKAKVCIVLPPAFLSPPSPRSFSDQRPDLLSLSAPASIRHASGVSSAGWNVNTPLSAACAGPTSRNPHC